MRRIAATLAAGYVFSTVHADLGVFRGLGDFSGGATNSSAFGVSADGHVAVGISFASAPHAFRWSTSGGLENLGPQTGIAFATNLDGSIVVGDVFRWTRETGAVPLSGASMAQGISADGTRIAANRELGGGIHEACVIIGSSIQGIGDLPGGSIYSQALDISPNGAVVVGDSQSSNGYEAFRWTAENGIEALGALPSDRFESIATGVSADGAVIVGYGNSGPDPGGDEAFRWSREIGLVGLGRSADGGLTRARAVSFDGRIIVGEASALGQQRAFIWTAEDGMRDLQAVIAQRNPDLIPNGWQLATAEDIAANGRTIVGLGVNPRGESEAWFVRLPCCECTDLGGNGAVDLEDLALLLSNFGNCGSIFSPPFGDIDGDGCASLTDLSILLANFGQDCSPP